MSTNGQLNGSRNGNGLLNGNGNKSPSHVKPKQNRLKNWITNFRYSNAPYIILGCCFWAALLGGGALYGHYHPRQEPPIDPRTERIEKTIEQLQDAIDVLKDELPDDSDDHDYTSPYLQ